MDSEKVVFTNVRGQKLAGVIDHAAGAMRGVALFAHCFSCGMDLRVSDEIVADLTDRGIAVMRFDFTGLGDSEGEFGESGFEADVSDLVAAADYLTQNFAPPTMLVGHSLGGAAVIAAAPKIGGIEAVVSIGAPSDPAHVTTLFADELSKIRRDGAAEVCLAGRTFRITEQLLDDTCDAELSTALESLTAPLLVIHAAEDEVVDFSHAERIFAQAAHPKSLVAIDQADHLLNDRANAKYVGDLIGHWATRHLGGVVRGTQDAADAAAEGAVSVAERPSGKFSQVVRVADRHVLLADEPEGIGDDTGPAPYDFLLAALGACTSMTIRMYANRKGWPLEHVAVSLTHDRIHAKDCESCETETGKVDVIKRELTVVGDLTEDQRESIAAIADRCPVHQTLHSETLVETTLQSEAASSRRGIS